MEAAEDPTLRRKHQSAGQDDAWGDARDEARDAAEKADRLEAWGDAWQDISGESWVTAWSAMRALIAWDESSDLLDMDPDAVKMIATIGDGPRKYQAVLMYPYTVYLSVRGLTK